MGSYLNAFREGVWATPDAPLRAAGIRGELLIAKIRLSFSGLLLLMPLVGVYFGNTTEERLVGFGAIGCLFLFSIGVYHLARTSHSCPWLGLLTGCFDVTLVSASLASFLLLDSPHAAVNSKVVFEGYFLAIATATLRYDKRVCVVAGLLALAEYLSIVIVASTYWDLNNEALYGPFGYGMFSWGPQISRLIAIAIASALGLMVVSRTQQLLRLSASDSLTGLFNRNYFRDRLMAEIGRSGRTEGPLVVIMLDVDHFKEFNDLFGHAAGDRVLKSISSTIGHSFRKSDVVARYGGDEFVVLMPDTDVLTALDKFEELQKVIASSSFGLRKSAGGERLTLSAGVAGFPVDGGTEDELIGVADARLFEAKRGGRNHVVWQGGTSLRMVPGADH